MTKVQTNKYPDGKEPHLYGGQDWTALCLVLAEHRHVEAIKLPYGEDVLDNFYLHENVDRFFDIFT